MKYSLKCALILLMTMSLGVTALKAQDLDELDKSEELKKTTLVINEHFIDMPIRDVVDRIADITGKTITLGKNVSGVVRNVKINGLYWTKALRVIARDIDGYFID